MILAKINSLPHAPRTHSLTVMRLLLFNLATDADDSVLGFATRWIRALAARVEQIDVLTMRSGRIEVPENVRIFSVGKEKGYSEPRRAVEFYRYLRCILGEDKIDVCFSHMMPLFTVLAAPVLKANGIPIVTWYAHRKVTRMLKLAHHLSDRMVASAPSSYHYKHDKLLVVGQGIDTNLFSPDGTTSEIPPLLLSVGRLSPIKDLLTLIEAINLLRQRGCEVRCVLVGDAPEQHLLYAETLHQRVQALGLSDSIIFAGGVPNENVVHWYRRCFAHVNCSPSDHSLDKTVLEAMACGKLSFSSTLGFQETMGKWADLLLFQQGNPADLADKLETLLQLSDAQQQAIGTQLRYEVVERHGLDRLTGKLVDIFDQLCL